MIRRIRTNNVIAGTPY